MPWCRGWSRPSSCPGTGKALWHRPGSSAGSLGVPRAGRGLKVRPDLEPAALVLHLYTREHIHAGKLMIKKNSLKFQSLIQERDEGHQSQICFAQEAGVPVTCDRPSLFSIKEKQTLSTSPAKDCAEFRTKKTDSFEKDS